MDGGINWNYKGVGSYLYFLNNDVGWKISGNTIYSTVDSGDHWESYTLDFMSESFIYFVTSKIGWLVGSEGRIYKTITGGVVTEIENRDNMNKPNEFALLQNYPNPFNPFTKISYSISNSDFMSLKIYNMLGQEIHILVNEFKIPGEYTVSFNAKNLSSGVYFYKLQVGDPSKNSGKGFVETKKMILMR
jgi:hypothetical protein